MGKHTKPRGSRGVAYVRISGDKQDMDSQRSSIKRWLSEQGLKVAIWYEDIGSRHEAYKRPEFQRMLAAVRAGDIDWVIVESKDRFGTRDSYEFGKFASELRDNDVELWSAAAGHLTEDDYTTEILTAVDSVRSRDEQLERSRRALRGMSEVWEQGRYNGAYPPYGFDVACLGPGRDGKLAERWRVVYEGHQKRVKVYPDGRRERYDGKANFPARDKVERLELVVSSDPRKAEAVQAVFRWFATESITYGAIAQRLNALGVDPIYSQAWYVNRVIGILKNPAYLVGKSVGNKQGHGSFFSLRNGRPAPAPTKRGRALNYRPHQETDFIYPKEWGEGIVDRDTWDAVQAKLKGVHKTRRSPRSPELWLGQFLYCGHCNQRMTGWTQRTHKNPHSYVCASFRRYGAANKYGCRLHRIQQTTLVELVDRFLSDTDQKLEEVLAAQPTLSADSVGEGLDRSEREFCRLVTAVWQTIKKWRVKNPTGRPWAANTLSDAFRLHSAAHQAKERAELEKLKRSHTEAAERYLELPPRAREVVLKKLDELEQQIAALEERLQPMDQKLGELRSEITSAHERVRAAREASQGSNHRRKAEALSKVLARIVCHFDHYRHERKDGGPAKDRSRLAKAVFEPLSGDGRVYTTQGDDDVRNEIVPNPRSSSANSTARSGTRSPRCWATR